METVKLEISQEVYMWNDRGLKSNGKSEKGDQLKNYVEKFSGDLESVSSSTDNEVFHLLLHQMAENKRLKEKIASMQAHILECVGTHAEIETVGENKIVWKISLSDQKMKDTEKEKVTVIHSQPFHLKRLHYKACFQLYVNGSGIGEGSHMSLFLMILKGEFDDYLQWPFTHKVTFKLINQTRNADIIHTFQPDPIMKPESDDGPGIGCLQFVSHSELKKSGYVEDDTMFIECEVHPIRD